MQYKINTLLEKNTNQSPTAEHSLLPRSLFILIITLSTTLLPITKSLHAAQVSVADEVEQLLRTNSLDTSTISIVVKDLDSDSILIDHDGEKLMLPASNMKLLTTGVTLLSLGPDFSFQTKTLKDDQGRIIIVGSGDPGFADPVLLKQMNISVNDLADLWVSDLVEAGITNIPELIIDDQIFDQVRTHPKWMTEDLLHGYGAQVAGFNFFANTAHFYFKPARQDGAAPTYAVEPDITGQITIRNLAKTRLKSSDAKRNSLWLDRKLGTNNYTISGKIRLPAETDITVNDPALTFTSFLAQRLHLQGIKVNKIRRASNREQFPNAKPVGRTIRTRLQTILHRANTDSANLYAECLIKRLGHDATGQPGSWVNGPAVIRAVVAKELGPALATQLIVSDGSGLSRDNRTSARMFVAWLANMNAQDDPISNLYHESLARPSRPGTLRNRFKTVKITGKVEAKSGYMRGISCLTGYLTSPKGRTAAFSILINDIPPRIPISKAKLVQEKIVKIVDQYLLNQESALLATPADKNSTTKTTENFGG